MPSFISVPEAKTLDLSLSGMAFDWGALRVMSGYGAHGSWLMAPALHQVRTCVIIAGAVPDSTVVYGK